jgi:hypothetical protein
VSPVKYELGFISQKTPFFIVNAVKTSNLTSINRLGCVMINVSPVRYELGFYFPEDEILHNNRRENHKSYIALTGWAL